MKPRHPHLLVSISSHGFGHGAQTALVINALGRRIPDLRVTLFTAVPRSFLAKRIDMPFQIVPTTLDRGMVMHSAVDVAQKESAALYQHLHRHWPQHLGQVADMIKASGPDLVLSNISYLSIAAAHTMGIPATALCSLNWADIYGHYCGERAEAAGILVQMQEAYLRAAYFFKPMPSMPMEWLDNDVAVGPLARLGKNRRQDIEQILGLAAGQRLILVAPGGIQLRLPVERWPSDPSWCWLVPQEWGIDHPCAYSLEALGMDFIDVLCSCDALITKPGYGSFAEAACNGVPLLFVARGDWPEEPYLTSWLAQYGRCAQVARDALEQGTFLPELESLLALSPGAKVQASGEDQVANIITSRFFPSYG